MLENELLIEHDSDGLPQYEVKAIIRQRTKFGRLQYLVKWKRMTSKNNTWEFADNLQCDDLISKFLHGEEEEYEYESETSTDSEADSLPSATPTRNKRAARIKDARPCNIQIPQIAGPIKKEMGPAIFYKSSKEKDKLPKITDGYRLGEKIYFVLTTPDGTTREIPSITAKTKYPLLVIDYLEKCCDFEEEK
ncbi:hypothetical protein TRFO_40059 [Tritrichomonas foetus]|uniref:Chromo domain-containing protein n=1 Tax=Tritrichomonas foetus TaxID=1144522 RepID=A0A1J4J4Q9_9EUKA|nr:hypothetical protein TRFO_40059 [Tritrichomonas foetus]|eukprot:OHS93681.1 hypothetical protein TRFO_40059 [Tritrichomonas foetus]